MLLAFISLTGLFYPLSEKEFAQGYCNLSLGVSPLYPAAKLAWLLELKYLPSGAKPARIEAAFAEAAAQVARYASDERLVPLLTQGQSLKAGSLVFVGAQKVLFRPWPEPAPAPAPRAAKRAATPEKNLHRSPERPRVGPRGADRARILTPFTLGEKRGGALQRRQHHEVRRRVLRCVGGCVGEAVFADDAVRRAREALIHSVNVPPPHAARKPTCPPKPPLGP